MLIVWYQMNRSIFSQSRDIILLQKHKPYIVGDMKSSVISVYVSIFYIEDE